MRRLWTIARLKFRAVYGILRGWPTIYGVQFDAMRVSADRGAREGYFQAFPENVR